MENADIIDETTKQSNIEKTPETHKVSEKQIIEAENNESNMKQTHLPKPKYRNNKVKHAKKPCKECGGRKFTDTWVFYPQDCPTCDGNGEIMDKVARCVNCNGQGDNFDKKLKERVLCEACNGKKCVADGKKQTCTTCKGKGEIDARDVKTHQKTPCETCIKPPKQAQVVKQQPKPKKEVRPVQKTPVEKKRKIRKPRNPSFAIALKKATKV